MFLRCSNQNLLANMKRVYPVCTLYPAAKALLLFLFIFSKPVDAQNLLVNGDFESSGGFNTNYFLASTPGTSTPREYNVLTNPFDMNNLFFSNASDHTFGNGTGKMMVVDGSGNAGDKVWELINGGSIGVQSGRTYIFSYWVRSISASNDASNSAIIKVYTNGTTTAPVLIAGSQTCPTGNPSPWVQVSYTWTATTNNAQIWLTDEQTNGGGAGNDFALDDITLVEDNGPLSLRYCTNGPACPGSGNGVIAAWGRGGVPPYYFSLNNGAFQPISIFPLPAPSAGNELRIIDSKSPVPDTAFSAPLMIDIPAAANQLSISNDTSICLSAAVNLTASGGTNYVWTANTAANIANLSSTSGAAVTATPAATTTYTVTADLPSVNLISNPGFENGDSSFYSDYKFYAATTNQQAYGITSNAQLFDVSFSACTSHNPGGKMMVVDGATSVKQVWSQVVSVIPNTTYTFSFYMQTLALPVPAQLNVSINGQVLGIATAPATTCNWVQSSYTWNAGVAALAYIDLVNVTTAANGNDFALDDLSFTTVCTGVQKSVTITVGNLSAPTVTVTQQPDCGLATGSLTITSPTGLNIVYSVDRTNYQTGNVFTGLMPTDYFVTVKDTVTGCVSDETRVIINPPPLPPAPSPTLFVNPTCTVTTGSFSIADPIGPDYSYSIDGINYQASPQFTGVLPGNYYLTVKENSTGCVSLPTAVPIAIAPVPNPPSAPVISTAIQPSCTTPTGSFSIASPLGADYLYGINGVNYQPGTSFNNLTPGNYAVTVMDTSTGCISPATNFIINTIPGLPPAPTAAVTVQPSCAVPTGAVVIFAPLGANYVYGYDGVNYQAGTTFTGLQPGTYPFTVKDNNTGCISLITGVPVNPGGSTPPAAIINITQPTCAVSTGVITVTNPQAGNTYSFDNGVTFQNGTVYTAAAGATYQVIIKNAAGCISAATSAVVNNIPPVPPAPTVESQTNCSNPITGTITVTSPLGTNYVYSRDGVTYQSSPFFTGLTPAAYAITYKDNNTGCISSGIQVSVSGISPGPAAPILGTPIQPDCILPTGSVIVTAPLGVNYVYSKDGVNYQTSPSFPGLSPNTYSIRVKDNSSGCTSSATQVTINAVPPSPPIPTIATVINNNCINSTISVTITSPLGNAFVYSKDAVNFQVSPLFDSLPAGNYNFVVKEINTGCISSSSDLSYSGSSNTPPPSVTDTIRYCQGATASTLTATGQNLQWYDVPSGGTVLPTAPLPPTTISDTSIYYVTQTLFGCESSRVPITVIVNAVPVLPSVASPVVFCQSDTATALSPSGNNYAWYTVATGGSSSDSIIPVTTAAGSTSYYVSESVNGCEGPRATVTVQVNAAPVLEADKLLNLCAGQAADLTTQFSTTGFTTGYFFNTIAVANPSAVTENGEYLITASAGNGCNDSATLLLIIRPPVPVFAGNDFTTAADQPAQLSAQGGGDFFVWEVLQPSAGVVFSNLATASPTATFSEGTHILQVMTVDDIGCTGYDTIVVTANRLWQQVYVPNAFSPNNDPRGLNETFKPSAQSIASLKYFRVFNRYGQVIFETNQLNRGWNGTYKGVPQPVGNYTWVLSCTIATGREVNMKGSVVLLR